MARLTEAINSRLFSAPWMQQLGHTIFDVADGALEKGFLKITKWAWLLLNLAFSFEPPAQLVRVPAGSAFDGDYMEDMTMMLQSEEGYNGGVHHEHSAHDDDDDDDDDMVVGFMCFPGFTVRDTIIKAGVCLI